MTAEPTSELTPDPVTASAGQPASPAPPAEPPAEVIHAAFAPQPLHRSQELEWHPASAVILFNTPAEADAAQPLLPDTVTIGWSGDPASLDQFDWSPLLNRQVFIWPAASHASKDLAVRLIRVLKSAVILRPPADWSRPGQKRGMDIADAASCGFTTAEAQAHFAIELQRIEDEYEQTRRSAAVTDANPAPEPDNPPINDGLDESPFRVLGHNQGFYYYLPVGTQQVVRLEGREHSRANLVTLAPTAFWQSGFSLKPPTVDWNAAGESMIRRAERVGLFDPMIIRGRGCWIDPTTPTPENPTQRVVFHAGDQIICGKQSYSLTTFPSRYVYERAAAFTPETATPLTNLEAKKFATLCESLSWRAPLYGKLLAGWCMAAAVCGALRWRPHIWVTGPAGSGKSWTIENIINRFLDRFALSALSSTTEAGMRQAIGRDAMPVVLDEAESEDEKGRSRFKTILDLVRQASSESGGSIFKGSMSGTAMEFRVRSAFCFASIGVAAVARADTSRITVLTLTPRGPADTHTAFEITKSLARDTILLPSYAAALRARAIDLALQIRQNAETFSQAVALKLGDNRTGDQIGALLAGAYALTSTRAIPIEDARAWVELQDWSEFTPQDVDKDETRALSHLAQSTVRIETSKGPHTTSIGNLITTYYDRNAGDDARSNAEGDLLLRGIKPTHTYIDVSCSHPELAKIFKETIWASKWKDQLARVTGYIKTVPSAKFGAAFNRAVRLTPTAFGCEPLPGQLADF